MWVEKIIKANGGIIDSSEDSIENVIKKYISIIPKGYNAYLVSDIKVDDAKKNKCLKNALNTYALKVRKDEVIGFIDTSLLNNGKDGLLFSKYGIAFDYAFEKVFIRYEEIYAMKIEKGKDLILYGYFPERKEDTTHPLINGICFNLEALKECIEEIQRFI